MQPVCSVHRIQPSALCDRAVRSAKQPAATLWQMKSDITIEGVRERRVEESRRRGVEGGEIV